MNEWKSVLYIITQAVCAVKKQERNITAYNQTEKQVVIHRHHHHVLYVSQNAKQNSLVTGAPHSTASNKFCVACMRCTSSYLLFFVRPCNTYIPFCCLPCAPSCCASSGVFLCRRISLPLFKPLPKNTFIYCLLSNNNSSCEKTNNTGTTIKHQTPTTT